jgi:acylphosphatase
LKVNTRFKIPGILLELINQITMIKHLDFKVTGRVQRVGFRFLTLKRAYELGIYGYVKNLKEKDSLYIEAEGREDAMNLFVKWVKRGPPFSEVKNVEIYEGEVRHYNSFEILSETKNHKLQHA